MSSYSRTTRFTVAAGLAAVSVLAALASPAGALPPRDEDPPDPPARADLRVSALSVVAAGSNWSIGYTVTNSGTKAAPATTIGFNGGPGLVASRSVPSLGIGAASSGSVQLARTAECFVVMNATADSARVVVESNESNTRSAVTALPGCPPRYRISAYSFKALDESGPDWSGSDEPFWSFNTVSTGGTATSTGSAVFGDVDSGETRYFGSLCTFGCGGGGALAPLGIGLSVQLWEEDLGDVDQVYYDIAGAFATVGPLLVSAGGAPGWVDKAGPVMTSAVNYILGWADNDLLGKSDFAYAPEYLAATLPSRGTSFTDTRIFGDSGSDAHYSLQLTVQRII